MRIAVCDGDIAGLKKMKGMIYEYANSHCIELLVDCYNSAFELLGADIKYRLIILDYNIYGLNGLETARLLRQNGEECELIFVSAYTGFIIESFKVNPYRFLLKPLDKQDLFAALNDFFRRTDSTLWIKDGDNTFCVSARDILYLEADNKNCFMSLEEGKIHCHKTMARVSGALPDRHFCKINRAFIVNFNHITGFNSDSVRLKNGELLRMTRNYRKNFEVRYRDFSDPRIF